MAVNNLNLTINKGEIYGLLGPNGAGKSTIILMLLGLTEPTSGSISVAGFNSTRDPLKVKRITGYLPEKVGFYEDMTARDNTGLYRRTQ
ncbi:MAG: ATP-binding cassette domain-containing protein [Actinomycetota bacterium]|nr:ATP-binding cassette domain-containing protein [Actinomycetota bacterium]